MNETIRIGTRGSRMALHQAEQVQELLRQRYPDRIFEIVVIQSEGDINQGDLRPFGGKGAFVKALDAALLHGRIDLAVNCMKDIPQSKERPPELVIVGALPREEIVDAFITKTGTRVSDLPLGSIVGTSAPRRQALLKRFYPHLECRYLRGSSDTRVRKLDGGEVDAVILAMAGLRRISLEHRVTELVDPTKFLPAIGAGIVTMDCVRERTDIVQLLREVSDANTLLMVEAERSFIDVIQGSCHTAIGGYSRINGSSIEFIAAVMSLAGEEMLIEHQSGDVASPALLGEEVAVRLRARGADRLLHEGRFLSIDHERDG